MSYIPSITIDFFGVDKKSGEITHVYSDDEMREMFEKQLSLSRSYREDFRKSKVP